MDVQEQLYLTANRGTSLIALCSIMIGLTTIAASLRVWSRALLPRNKFQLDDFAAFIAWVFVVSFCVSTIAEKKNGLGHHTLALRPAALTTELKLFLAGINLSLFALYFTRISALLFYRRVFQVNSRWFKIAVSFGIVVNTLWVIAFFLLTLFGCRPMKKFWEPSIPGHCLPLAPTSQGSNVSSVFMDLYILILPMPMVWGLHLNSAKKIILGFVFFIGYCAIFLSIGRLVAYSRVGDRLDTDPIYEYVVPIYWVTLEISITFISATVPSIFHLFRRGAIHGPTALFSDDEYDIPSSSWIQEKTSPLRKMSSFLSTSTS